MGWEPAIPETMPAGDMTVVAQWRINSYSLTYKVDGEVYKNYEVDDASYTKAFSFSTEPLSLEPQQPMVIINTDRLWKYRAYYEANTGNRYYSQWIGIDPSNTSYFEPTVHTYSIIDLIGNMAEIWGYVMRGTDNITIQGFIYWNVTISSSSRKNAKGIPVNATKVLSSGNVMSAKLENLDYETTYCYVAFVTTSEGETFYGEPQTFRTGEMDEDGIKDIEHSPLNIEEAWYSLDGKKLSKPQKGINIIRYSDGTNKKVLVK